MSNIQKKTLDKVKMMTFYCPSKCLKFSFALNIVKKLLPIGRTEFLRYDYSSIFGQKAMKYGLVQGFPNFPESRRLFSINVVVFFHGALFIYYLFGRAGGGLLLQQIRNYKIGSIRLVAIFTLLSLSLSIYISSIVKILYISMSNK